MAEHSRYNIGMQQAGLDGLVLKNRLSITDPDELMDAETLLLNDAYTHFTELIAQEKFSVRAGVIFDIHKYVFATLYDWAGQVRSIDISKEDILFADGEQ